MNKKNQQKNDLDETSHLLYQTTVTNLSFLSTKMLLFFSIIFLIFFGFATNAFATSSSQFSVSYSPIIQNSSYNQGEFSNGAFYGCQCQPHAINYQITNHLLEPLSVDVALGATKQRILLPAQYTYYANATLQTSCEKIGKNTVDFTVASSEQTLKIPIVIHTNPCFDFALTASPVDVCFDQNITIPIFVQNAAYSNQTLRATIPQNSKAQFNPRNANTLQLPVGSDGVYYITIQPARESHTVKFFAENTYSKAGISIPVTVHNCSQIVINSTPAHVLTQFSETNAVPLCNASFVAQFDIYSPIKQNATLRSLNPAVELQLNESPIEDIQLHEGINRIEAVIDGKSLSMQESTINSTAYIPIIITHTYGFQTNANAQTQFLQNLTINFIQQKDHELCFATSVSLVNKTNDTFILQAKQDAYLANQQIEYKLLVELVPSTTKSTQTNSTTINNTNTSINNTNTSQYTNTSKLQNSMNATDVNIDAQQVSSIILFEKFVTLQENTSEFLINYSNIRSSTNPLRTQNVTHNQSESIASILNNATIRVTLSTEGGYSHVYEFDLHQKDNQSIQNYNMLLSGIIIFIILLVIMIFLISLLKTQNNNEQKAKNTTELNTLQGKTHTKNSLTQTTTNQSKSKEMQSARVAQELRKMSKAQEKIQLRKDRRNQLKKNKSTSMQASAEKESSFSGEHEETESQTPWWINIIVIFLIIILAVAVLYAWTTLYTTGHFVNSLSSITNQTNTTQIEANTSQIQANTTQKHINTSQAQTNTTQTQINTTQGETNTTQTETLETSNETNQTYLTNTTQNNTLNVTTEATTENTQNISVSPTLTNETDKEKKDKEKLVAQQLFVKTIAQSTDSFVQIKMNQTAQFNLSKWFYDPDGDTVNFYIRNVTISNHSYNASAIIMLNESNLLIEPEPEYFGIVSLIIAAVDEQNLTTFTPVLHFAVVPDVTEDNFFTSYSQYSTYFIFGSILLIFIVGVDIFLIYSRLKKKKND